MGEWKPPNEKFSDFLNIFLSEHLNTFQFEKVRSWVRLTEGAAEEDKIFAWRGNKREVSAL